MTLEEYEKVLEEKRKALNVKTDGGRKVDTKEFESLKPLSCKKENDEIFAKLVSFLYPSFTPNLQFQVFLVIMSINVFTFSNFQFSPQGSDKDRRKDAIEKEKARKV